MSVPVLPGLTALDPEQVAAIAWEPCDGWPGVEQKVLSRSPGLVLGLLRLAPGAREVPHLHGAGEHHVWVLEGQVRTPDAVLPSGSYVHVRPGTLHQLSDAGAGSTLLFAYRELGAL